MNLGLQVEDSNFFRRLDFNLIFIIAALMVIGLINLYSATHGVNPGELSRLFWQQVVWMMAGAAVFFGLTVVDYNIFRRIAVALYVFNLTALFAVMFFGKISYGARRWLDLGFFRYQPSETMKIILVLILAKVLASRFRPDGLGFRDLMLPSALALVPAALTIRQPDLGTGLLLISVFASMVLFVRVKRWIVVMFSILGIIAAPMVWTFGLKSYQKNRVLTFIAPGKDPRGAGYNSIQSRIAVGSGKVIGKGFRKGTQSQLEFLPERHTDFIFSVLSEEHGFIGSLTTVALFIALLVMNMRIASQARDRYGILVAVGATSILFWHFVVNICMVIGLLPIVGVPLPLLSYGGSMMLTTMACLGIVSSVSYRKYLF